MRLDKRSKFLGFGGDVGHEELQALKAFALQAQQREALGLPTGVPLPQPTLPQVPVPGQGQVSPAIPPGTTGTAGQAAGTPAPGAAEQAAGQAAKTGTIEDAAREFESSLDPKATLIFEDLQEFLATKGFTVTTDEAEALARKLFGGG
jgi:hypothetical protein